MSSNDNDLQTLFQHAGGIDASIEGDLRELFFREEFQIEKTYNRVTLWVISFFLLSSVILPFITGSSFLDTNVISTTSGIFAFFSYTLLTRFLLNRSIYHWTQKYITVFFSVSVITIIVAGYVPGVDFVHATRTITLVAYFPAIIASGLYQNPVLPLFASGLACAEYATLFLSAIVAGFPVSWRVETFRENILTFDILFINLIFYITSGVLVHFWTRRHRSLMREFRLSIRQLVREKKDRKISERKAAYYEKYDELTGLPNIKQFRSKLEAYITIAEARKRNFAVMCLGLDSFFSVNQLYGIEIGNAVLSEIGGTLGKAFRDDDICCRFMGDKFLILFADVKSSDSVSDLIKKTQNAFNEPLTIGGNRIRITACAGIVTFPNDGDDPDSLIEKSESAMYQAKMLGKNHFRLYDNKRQQELENRLLIEKELDVALENNEFFVVFQPKVNTEKEIIGAETLLRWSNPSLGIIGPDSFIPIAEKSGIIVPIGLFVFRECCRQVVKWSAAGMPRIRITVNVSSVQFGRRDFTDSIRKIIDETGADSQWLGIEITESGIMDNETDCIHKLKSIKAMGLTVSIDDFGNGYSSLSRLGNYPLDVLKIDKSFIDGLPESEISVTIVQSIIHLAHNLGYKVVAEGVETEKQWKFLDSLECDRYQGYFFYKPLAVTEFEKILLNPDGSEPSLKP